MLLAQSASLHMPLLPRLRFSSVLRDQNGQYWLYIIQHLNNGEWLLVAVARPIVPILTVLSDELMFPILGAAVAALIISLFVAFWLARWIGNPLQQVVVASRQDAIAGGCADSATRPAGGPGVGTGFQ